MDKFYRNYKLFVQTSDPSGKSISIGLPFTIDFDVQRNTLASLNYAVLRVYNLSQETRTRIAKDVISTDISRKVIFYAGYGEDNAENLPVVFKGNITKCWSVREGDSFVTQIEAFDGGFASANAIYNNQFIKATPLQAMIASIAGTLAPFGVAVGAIGTYPGELGRGNSFSVGTLELLQTLSGNGFFIDNMKVNLLNDSECLPASGIPLINSQTGLLGTPVREQTQLSFDILFEPRVTAGQFIVIDSQTGLQNHNGKYKVNLVKHKGTISSAVCGDAVTTLGVWYGTKKLQIVQGVTQ